MGETKIEYTPCIMYFPVIIMILIDGHDAECYMRWFVTWGVLCHSTITKILKCHGLLAGVRQDGY